MKGGYIVSGPGAQRGHGVATFELSIIMCRPVVKVLEMRWDFKLAGLIVLVEIERGR